MVKCSTNVSLCEIVQNHMEQVGTHSRSFCDRENDESQAVATYGNGSSMQGAIPVQLTQPLPRAQFLSLQLLEEHSLGMQQ